ADLPHPVRCTTSARLRCETSALIAVHWSGRSTASGPASARKQRSASSRSAVSSGSVWSGRVLSGPVFSDTVPSYQEVPTVLASGHDRGVAESWVEDNRPVRAFRPDPERPADLSTWPGTVPALAQILRDGLELPAGLTVLVGENGSGKSTVVETLA